MTFMEDQEYENDSDDGEVVQPVVGLVGGVKPLVDAREKSDIIYDVLRISKLNSIMNIVLNKAQFKLFVEWKECR